jgi:hypothetical protein
MNDVAAHKKQQESLSPDDKLQILNKDAAAHKKQQESLSPDDKVQILNKDKPIGPTAWKSVQGCLLYHL